MDYFPILKTWIPVNTTKIKIMKNNKGNSLKLGKIDAPIRSEIRRLIGSRGANAGVWRGRGRRRDSGELLRRNSRERGRDGPGERMRERGGGAGAWWTWSTVNRGPFYAVPLGFNEPLVEAVAFLLVTSVSAGTGIGIGVGVGSRLGFRLAFPPRWHLLGEYFRFGKWRRRAEWEIGWSWTRERRVELHTETNFWREEGTLEERRGIREKQKVYACFAFAIA